MEYKFFIPGNTPSSKNSKVYTGKFLVWSKTAQKYRKDTKQYWINHSQNFQQLYCENDFPLTVSFKFLRKSRHLFDYPNPLQTVLDLMVEYKWIPDDNADIIIPRFEIYEYNKNNPGVIITLIN